MKIHNYALYLVMLACVLGIVLLLINIQRNPEQYSTIHSNVSNQSVDVASDKENRPNPDRDDFDKAPLIVQEIKTNDSAQPETETAPQNKSPSRGMCRR